jgi:hypothetical protein
MNSPGPMTELGPELADPGPDFASYSEVVALNRASAMPTATAWGLVKTTRGTAW